MKKTLLSLIALFICAIAFAQTEIDGIYYNLNNDNKTAEVTYQYQYSSNNYYGVTTLTIPSSVTYNSETYSVTSIGYQAFSRCSSLTSITIPNSVTSIGSSAFSSCSSLTSITLPNSVTEIGGWAFSYCSSLTSISIPNSVTEIGSDAFYGTPWLNNQPDGCIYINNLLYTYKGEMPENTHITLNEGTTQICDDVFYDCDALTSITIPNSVTSIGDSAFYSCSSLTSITIPNSVTEIGNYAFYYCTSLTSITIPNSVTEIGNIAFSGTPWLNNQPDGCVYAGSCLYEYKGTMPENTHIDIKEGTIQICGSAFYECTSLASITIPNSVTEIGNSAFEDCRSLTSITIPNSVTSIGNEAFYECTSLTSITIPNSVTSIGNKAFYYCYALTSITIPNSVTSIGNNTAFRECYSLTSITSPATVFNQIEEESLSYYTNILEEIHVNAGELDENGFNFINRSKKSLHTIDLSGATNTTINDLAFYDCYKLENFTLPSNIETIGYKAFADCVHLKSLEIPATVVTIDERAFENCRSVASLTFAEGSNLKTIGAWAFYNNHNITDVTIPESVEVIGDAAFYGCNYLENITLPASVQSIGDNGFALCNQVKRMEVKSTTPPTIEAKTFFQVSRDIEFIVPEEARNAYAEHEYWKEFIQSAPDNLENNESENAEIFSQNGSLHIDGITTDYQIYNPSGQLVYSGNASTLSLPRGIYLITIKGETQKIAL